MEQWVDGWFGYKRDRITLSEMDSQNSRELEIQWFKWMVSKLSNKETPNLIEVGSGWGAWCLAMAGLLKDKDYHCYAIEANPEYIELTKQHLIGQGIKCQIIECAVTDKIGTVRFNTDFVPFGQGIIFDGFIKGSHKLAWLWGILHLLFHKTVKVKTLTLDSLLDKYQIDHVDILQMDIQGTEVKAIQGAEASIINNRIDYLMIGTHHRNNNLKLLDLLSPYYNLVVNIYPSEGDGLQVYQRKELNG